MVTLIKSRTYISTGISAKLLKQQIDFEIEGDTILIEVPTLLHCTHTHAFQVQEAIKPEYFFQSCISAFWLLIISPLVFLYYIQYPVVVVENCRWLHRRGSCHVPVVHPACSERLFVLSGAKVTVFNKHHHYVMWILCAQSSIPRPYFSLSLSSFSFC